MSERAMTVHVNVAERVLEQVTAAAARAVSQLHRPVPTTLGPEVFACEHCTSLRQVHIVRWPCPTRRHADQAATEAARAES